MEADAGLDRDRVERWLGVVGVGEGERALPGGAVVLVDGVRCRGRYPAYPRC